MNRCDGRIGVGAGPPAVCPFTEQGRRDALILALIAIVAIVALIFLGNQVSTILSKVGNSV